jgi:hypothetical protein
MIEGGGYWSRHYQLQVILLRNITHTQTKFSSIIDSPSTRCPFSENKQNHLQQIWETAPINSQIQSSSFHGSRSFRWACGRFSSPRWFSSENGRSLMFTPLHSYGIHMAKLDNFDLSAEPTTKKGPAILERESPSGVVVVTVLGSELNFRSVSKGY